MKQSFIAFGLSIALILFITASVFSQDIHFSQFFNTPLALGPGSIGAFKGNYRLNTLFRQQWRAVTVPYRTFALGGDAANIFGIKGLGLGAWAFNDRAGDSRLQQFHLSVGASYSLRLGRSGNSVLITGLQGGFTSLSLDNSALSFDAQYNGFQYDPSRATGEQFSRSSMFHPDLNAGMVYRYAPNDRQLTQVGLGLFNLTTPNIGFLGEPGVPLDRRAAVHVITQFPVTTKLDVLPMARYMRQGAYEELDLGANLRYILLDKFGLKRALQFGGHYRAADAGYLYAGFEYDDWTFGLSYDINTSDLVPASRNRGGIEISVIRIFKKYPPVPVRYKACPAQL
ncbi:MAG: PorP/SprF family type IX secretion system membrane protein [Flavobacteriales bacterium]|nr:PorP/SprF family type IX secretion system membrane protein [Flavobacteriales bacterium]MBK7239032.1 PorP/SprF family type IX secretion system membrane protein [Flavobacteriales bacterium]MBK7296790.1 PorP/SprF family type IX secretion system membrane protein [Flavobacteriales bacterium]MBK9536862.1 PorP/SprF family type IX secretion system membrane protein [Flavobacteriales bacterium]HQX31340.1 PorP/SprF family type IX secretion system membrane protein [Flavobacteriales bacterium]